MNKPVFIKLFFTTILFFICATIFAQSHPANDDITTRISTHQITVGDRARIFLQLQHDPKQSSIQWAAMPDSVNGLEIVEKSKIDTVINGSITTYRQKLEITGFDSGLFEVPSFKFRFIPKNGDSAYFRISDSFQLLVQTIAVDTTKAFKPIKNIIYVKASWLDYIWYFVGGVILLIGIVIFIIYMVRKKKPVIPETSKPVEPLHDRTLRLLNELEAKQLWQKNKVKDYYVELTDIVRVYIEERFYTPAMELTTDELLEKTRIHKELMSYHDLLSMILHTADLAKFAKAQPLPEEHVAAMENATKFVHTSKPIIIQTPTEKQI